MIDLKIEEFTAAEAVKAGLIDAVKNGEVKINGTYELTQSGNLECEQNNFCFTDRYGNLRAGRFKDRHELLDFSMVF